MAQQVIDETVATQADAASVYALLADGSTWPEWSPIDSFEPISPGDGTPEGLGAVRLFTTGRHKSRERVVTCQPGKLGFGPCQHGCELSFVRLTARKGSSSSFRTRRRLQSWRIRARIL